MSSDQFLRSYSAIKSPLENSINLNSDMSYEQFLRSYTGFKSLLENSIYLNPDLNSQEEKENNKIDNSNILNPSLTNDQVERGYSKIKSQLENSKSDQNNEQGKGGLMSYEFENLSKFNPDPLKLQIDQSCLENGNLTKNLNNHNYADGHEEGFSLPKFEVDQSYLENCDLTKELCNLSNLENNNLTKRLFFQSNLEKDNSISAQDNQLQLKKLSLTDLENPDLIPELSVMAKEMMLEDMIPNLSIKSPSTFSNEIKSELKEKKKEEYNELKPNLKDTTNVFDEI